MTGTAAVRTPTAPAESVPDRRQPVVATPPPVDVAHIANVYRCYPGEIVTYFTRVDVLERIPGFTLQIKLPAELTPGEATAALNHARAVPELVVLPEVRYVTWTVDEDLKAGARFEYQLQATIAQVHTDVALECRAAVSAENSDGERLSATESAEISVRAKGSYLKHLPALFESDELLGRLLMLFESFWHPIERQIDHVAYYFDPQMTPPDLLPFLASWLDLTLDEGWPEARRRRLLQLAAALHRRRGTKRGLREILEIYTGGTVQIAEHTANNFRIGPHAYLGRTIALGRNNRPHSFSVNVLMPQIAAEGGAEEVARLEAERHLTIEAIIEAEKPAHTTYNLVVETIAPD